MKSLQIKIWIISRIKFTDKRFVLFDMKKGGKITKFKKIGEIHGYKQDGIKEVAETLEKQGFVVVDDNELEESWKTYHILREV